jgi:outer membrane biosynthesis protein TonB
MRACDHRRGTLWPFLGALTLAVACGGSKTPPDTAASEESATGAAGEGQTDADDSTGDAPSDEASAAGGAEPKQASDPHRHEDETRTTAVIADVIKKNRDRARVCYDKAKKENPRLAGDVVIHFVLDPDGKVQEAELNQERSTIALPDLTSCIIDVLKSLPFPPSSRGMETKVNYPFNFKP